MKFLKMGLGSEAWMMPHQTRRRTGGGADTNAPPEAARRGAHSSTDHGTPRSSYGRTFSHSNTLVGFDVLIGQKLAFRNILLGLGLTDRLKVRIGIKNGACSATRKKKNQDHKQHLFHLFCLLNL